MGFCHDRVGVQIAKRARVFVQLLSGYTPKALYFTGGNVKIVVILSPDLVGDV